MVKKQFFLFSIYNYSAPLYLLYFVIYFLHPSIRLIDNIGTIRQFHNQTVNSIDAFFIICLMFQCRSEIHRHRPDLDFYLHVQCPVR